MNVLTKKLLVAAWFLAVAPNTTSAQDKSWSAITGEDTLRELVSDITAERKLPNGQVATGEYFADGTGVLHSWGVSIQRTWEIKGEDQFCVTASGETKCYVFEKSDVEDDLYRARDISSKIWVEFSIANRRAVAAGALKAAGSDGGPATPSAAEIAAELSNPNTVLGTLNTNLDYTRFDGDLPDAEDQEAWTMTFQPSLPYPVGDGKNIFLRPAIPVIFDQAVPRANSGFDDKGVELGDIGFDLAYGQSFKTESGVNVVLAGLAGTIPTATDDALGSEQWLLGPELGGFIVRNWGAVGGLIFHKWDVAGEDSYDTSITGGQYIYTVNLTDGWQIAGSPAWSYNHEADSDDALTLPLGTGIAKTSIIGGRPWKMSLQYWYYAEAPDDFGPKHLIRFTIGPVVSLPWSGSK
jgi:hypothetical protein